MSSIEDQLIRVANAQDYVASIGTRSIYALIGKQTPWANDASPDVPTSQTQRIYTAWRESLGAKRIQSGDVRPAANRVNWTTGTVYDQYDPYDSSLHLRNFFVLTTDNRIYKCLNNYGGAPSTVMPTAVTANAAIVTADNYRWKFMYQLTTDEVARFLSSNYVPVGNTASNNIAAGSIESYRIENAGSGLTPSSSFVLNIEGDGTGAAATAFTNSSGNIFRVTVSNAGSGYTYAIITGVGGGAVIRPNLAPPGGHGISNVKELFAKFVTHSIRFIYSESGSFTVRNDFRTVTFVRDPLLPGGSVATGSTYRTTSYFTFSSSSGTFSNDEQITSGSSPTKYANVVEHDTTAVPPRLYVNGIRNTFAPVNVVTGGTSGATGTINTIVGPELRLFSGDLFYYENRLPILRAIDQVETFKITFEF